MSIGSFRGVKRPVRSVDHPPSYCVEVRERVGLYLYSTSGFSWPVIGWILPFCSLFVLMSVPVTTGIPRIVIAFLWCPLMRFYVQLRTIPSWSYLHHNAYDLDWNLILLRNIPLWNANCYSWANIWNKQGYSGDSASVRWCEMTIGWQTHTNIARHSATVRDDWMHNFE